MTCFHGVICRLPVVIVWSAYLIAEPKAFFRRMEKCSRDLSRHLLFAAAPLGKPSRSSTPSVGQTFEQTMCIIFYPRCVLLTDNSIDRPSPPPPVLLPIRIKTNKGVSAVRISDPEKDVSSETNLIRAIQAAQQARGGGGGGGGGGDISRTWRMDGPPPGSGGGGESTAAAVLALHLVWTALEAASEALLPLWMLSPGGCAWR